MNTFIKRLIMSGLFIVLTNISVSQNLLNSPECVQFDSTHNCYLVSNYNSGAIVKIDEFGNQSYFITGLVGSRGMLIVDQVIYVSGISRVVGVNLNTAEVSMNLTIPGAGSLDGQAIDAQGNLYVVEPNLRKIYRINIQSMQWVEFIANTGYAFPQELAYDERNNRLLLCSWGWNSPVQTIDLSDRSVSEIASTSWGQYDGISIDAQGNIYLSTHRDGKIVKYDNNFSNPPVIVSTGHNGPAGLEINNRDELIIVPNCNANTVDFISLRGIAKPTMFRASSGFHSPNTIQLSWIDPVYRSPLLHLSNYKIHLFRDSLFLAVVDSGIQFYADSGLVRYQYYRYTIRTIVPDDSSQIDSAGTYAGGYCFISDTLSATWNLLSVPLTPYNNTLSNLFPNAAGSTFAYKERYVIVDSVSVGAGYWVKFNTATAMKIPGIIISIDTIQISPRWNLIGSLNFEIDSASIVTIPPGIIQTSFYRYDGSYQRSQTLEPGKGYWVKTSQAGSIILSSMSKTAPDPMVKKESSSEPLNTLRIIDAKGHRQELYFSAGKIKNASLEKYELPPPPPKEAFDVRFGSGRFAECVEGNSTTTLPILLQSPKYPLMIRWTILPDEQGLWSFQTDGSNTRLDTEGEIQLMHAKEINLVYNGKSESFPKEFALEQNYPNPFNPTTTIRYELPSDANVKIELLNILGQTLTTLVDEVQTAGSHRVDWNASSQNKLSFSSGIYFYRIQAVDVNNPNSQFSQIKKMVLLK